MNTTLGAPAGADGAYVTGISNTGVISGWGAVPDGPSLAVAWQLSDPDHPTVLNVPNSLPAKAVDVSARGLVAVVAGSGSSTRSFPFSREGRRVELKSILPGAYVEVVSVADGWAVGVERDPGVDPYPVRYDLKAGRAEAIDLPYGLPTDINVHGSVVGNDGSVEGDDPDHAWLYIDELTSLPSPDGSGDARVSTIDDSGDVAGYAAVSSFPQYLAATWQCGS